MPARPPGLLLAVLIAPAVLFLFLLLLPTRPVPPARTQPAPTYGQILQALADDGGSLTLYFDSELSFARVSHKSRTWEAHASNPALATYWALEHWLATRTP